MKFGFMELVVVFIVALLVIGPDKLPAFAQKLGKALQEFRKASADVTRDVRENVIEPLEDAQRPIREALEPLEDLDKAVRKDIKDVEDGLKNIGKPSAKKPEEKAEPEPTEASTSAAEPAEQADAQPAEESAAEPAQEIDESTGGETK